MNLLTQSYALPGTRLPGNKTARLSLSFIFLLVTILTVPGTRADGLSKNSFTGTALVKMLPAFQAAVEGDDLSGLSSDNRSKILIAGFYVQAASVSAMTVLTGQGWDCAKAESMSALDVIKQADAVLSEKPALGSDDAGAMVAYVINQNCVF